jgi:ABC-type proline/glycine betaine transport system substrate-binding protein
MSNLMSKASMSEAVNVAAEAVECVDTLIADMLEGKHPNNYVLLGTLQMQHTDIQIQLHVMQDENKFIDEVGAPLIANKPAALEKTKAQDLEYMLIHQPYELLIGITELQQKIKQLSQ